MFIFPFPVAGGHGNGNRINIWKGRAFRFYVGDAFLTVLTGSGKTVNITKGRFQNVPRSHIVRF